MERLIQGAKRLEVELTPRQLGQFHSYYREIASWNKQINLTAIVNYEEVQIKHFLDSLTVTLAIDKAAIKNEANLSVIDVGTGAGLPGIPIRILFPQIKLALLDSTSKKIAFLCHVTKQLGLDGIEIITGRAEEVAHQPQYREQFQLVLSRAVAKLATLAELTLPFCQIGGTVIAQKKGEIRKELTNAANAINTLGGKLRELKKIDLEEFEDERYLVIIDKTNPTPQEYPRRPGVPARRPIQ